MTMARSEIDLLVNDCVGIERVAHHFLDPIMELSFCDGWGLHLWHRDYRVGRA